MGKNTPARIVRKMFGTRALAKLLGITRDAVLKWDRNGRVPAKHQETLLAEAKARNLKLTADMLIVGA